MNSPARALGKRRAGHGLGPAARPKSTAIEDRLRRYLQTDVTVSVGKNDRGTLTLHFYSADDLERLLEVMRVPD